MTDRILALLKLQSERLDGQDEIYRDVLQALQRIELLQKQRLHMLNLILDRLPPVPAN